MLAEKHEMLLMGELISNSAFGDSLELSLVGYLRSRPEVVRFRPPRRDIRMVPY